MKENIRRILTRNWFFIILLLGIFVVLAKRYVYLQMDIVSHPDFQIAFGTEDDVLEQTWQPDVKEISGISVPYCAEDNFSCDVQLKIYSDDYSQILIDATRENFVFIKDAEGRVDFRFRKTAVIQGERYRIQLRLLNPTTDGKLYIAAGSNYGGCSISTIDTNKAAALIITYAKYSKWFWIVAILFPMLGYSLLIMILTGKKWEETVGISLFLEGIVLYSFGLWDHLLWGISAVYLSAALSLLLAIFFYNKRNVRMRGLISPGLWIYFILFIIIIMVNKGDWLGMRDDLRHWGMAVRDMYYYDSFANHVNTTVILPQYLPFAALIEYVFVYMNGLFSEDILLIAYQTMILNVMIVLCKPLQKKCNRKLFVPIILTMIGVPIIFFNRISSSIMVDSLLAAVTAYILICYYSEDMNRFNRVRIITALIALTLIKDMGLVFAGLTAFVMFGDSLIEQIREKRLEIKKLLRPVVYVVVILMVYSSWQFYSNISASNRSDVIAEEQAVLISHNDLKTGKEISEDKEKEIPAIFETTGISVDGLIKILSGNGKEYQYQVTKKFLIELLNGDTYKIAHFEVSFVEILVIMAFLIISLGYFGYWQDKKNRMYEFVILYFLAGGCLCAFLQLAYWFKFSWVEALILASVDRYLAPWGCMVVIVTLYLVYDGMQYVMSDFKKIDYLMFALSTCLIISVPVEGIVYEAKDIEGNTTEEITYGHEMLREILRSVAKRGERVYFICNDSDGYTEYVFRNAVCPIVSEHANWNIVSTEEFCVKQHEMQGELYDVETDNDNWSDVITLKEWKEKLKNCQYVVVFHADEFFAKSYEEVFGGDDAISDGCVYRVLQNGNNVSLDLIGQTGIKKWR